MQFVVPAQPKLRTAPPIGDDWVHEVKFDGWRVQLHKFPSHVTLYTKSGNYCHRRFPALTEAAADLPVRSCVIDGEVTASDDQGIPDFRSLHFRKDGAALSVWAFDLLYLNGHDLRKLALLDRKERLERLVAKTRAAWLATQTPSRMAPCCSRRPIEARLHLGRQVVPLRHHALRIPT
jgi:bifunctional non-homologous end joining protein LigD